MAEKIIYLEVDEEITSIIDRISGVSSKKIILVVPRTATLLQSMVNLKLLKKQADDLKKNIIIVTSDVIGRNLVDQVGLPVFKELERNMFALSREEQFEQELVTSDVEPSKAAEAVSVEVEKDQPKLQMSEEAEADEIEPAETAEQPKPTREPSHPRKPWIKPIKINKGVIIILVALLVFVLSGVAFLALPKATVDLTVKAKPLEQSIPITVDTKAVSNNLAQKIISGELVEKTLDGSADGIASGTKNAGAKARGEITVYNYWDSTPQTLVTGTRFRSANGLNFTSLKSVTVPGTSISQGQTVAGQANVTVEAGDFGERYNLGANRYSIPGLSGAKQAKIYGQGGATSGGYTKNIKIVSDSDVAGAKEQVIKDLRQKAVDQAKAETAKDKYLLNGVVSEKITSEQAAPAVGQEADRFKFSLKVTFALLRVNRPDLMQITTDNIKLKLSADQELAGADDNLGMVVTSYDEASGKIAADLQVKAKIAPKIDESQLKQLIKNRNREATTQILLQNQNISEAKVTFWPVYVRRIPYFNQRIIIVKNYSTLNDANKE